MSVRVEVITFDENIYQVVTLFPDCRQYCNIGLPARNTPHYLKEALFVMCSVCLSFCHLDLQLYVALYFLSAEDQCVFLSQKQTAFHWLLICIGLEQATVIIK